ncbi:MAG: competence/damage-inducible protein A [Kofleriaceae bacterium]|nr:competence/damage-inducible protein A [Kofleriaceae bacterium]MCL4224826.1 competence/damage-inducible protein A [Myxococcales bacterium]
MGATAGIVVIGDEILSGKFGDENARFLIAELRSLGVELRRISVIPDDLDDIADTVPRFARRFDHVFTSGGVGPTHDDLTMEGIARGFGTRVVRVPELEARVRAYWGDKLAPANLRLAEVPDGAQLLYGDPVWPVVAYQNVYILPGVPGLFRRKFQDIRERFRAAPLVVARLYARGDEGVLAPHLDAVVAAHPGAKLGSYPRFEAQDYRVLVTVEGADPAAVGAAVDDLAARLGELVVRVEPAA